MEAENSSKRTSKLEVDPPDDEVENNVVASKKAKNHEIRQQMVEKRRDQVNVSMHETTLKCDTRFFLFAMVFFRLRLKCCLAKSKIS